MSIYLNKSITTLVNDLYIPIRTICTSVKNIFFPSKLNFQPQRNINNISYITICMYIAHTSSLSTAINLDFLGVFKELKLISLVNQISKCTNFHWIWNFFRNTNLWFFLGQLQKIHVMGNCAIKNRVRREMAIH